MPLERLLSSIALSFHRVRAISNCSNFYQLRMVLEEILIIAEKPSVAKSIGEVVGARNKREGGFEGNGYFVTSAFGSAGALPPRLEIVDA
jgi:hypothetical protein